MKLNKKFGTLAMAFLVLLTGCTAKTSPNTASAKPFEVNVSAAASLKDALGEIQTLYAEHSKDTLLFNFAGSGALQKQIEEGASCDLFISAAKSNMDALEKAGLILTDTRKDLLGNQLVLISSKEMKGIIKNSDAMTISEVKSIAIGSPDSVPAGQYAKQTLNNLGLWDKVQDKLILAKDVKQVLEFVETGNADCGFVYATDALLLKTGVTLTQDFSAAHDHIVYPAALIKDSASTTAAKNFYDFLGTEAAKKVFKKYGFDIME